MSKQFEVEENEVATKFVSFKNLSTKPEWFERRVNDLKKRILGKRKVLKSSKNVTLRLEEAEFESVIDALERLQKSIVLADENRNLKKEIDELENKLDDKAFNELVAIEWAKKAIPSKGATIKDYQEAAFRIGIVKPKRGKRNTYDPEKVLEYHQIVINTLIEKNQTLSTEQKRTAVQKVYEKFGLASYGAARKYLTRQNAENLPFSD